MRTVQLQTGEGACAWCDVMWLTVAGQVERLEARILRGYIGDEGLRDRLQLDIPLVHNEREGNEPRSWRGN